METTDLVECLPVARKEGRAGRNTQFLFGCQGKIIEVISHIYSDVTLTYLTLVTSM